MMTRTFLLLFLGLLSPARYSHQAPTRWAWFRASSVINDWAIDKGQADVTIDGQSFKATLWDATDQKFARLSLNGSINQNVVSVKATVNNSDYGLYRTSGRLRRTCWEEGGREAILLTSGFGVIGLVREIPAAGCRILP